MPRARIGILGVVGLLALHLFMLSGGGAELPGTQPVPQPCHQQAGSGSVATAPCDDHVPHDMAMACLAILAGLALLRTFATTGARAGTVWPLTLRHRAAPVLRPPTPPPIARGISRT